LRDGHALTVGPFAPLRDGSFQPRPSPVELWTKQTRVPATSSGEPDAIRALVEQAANALDLPTLPAAPEDIFVTVHENDQGRQTVLFVINPTPRPIESQVTAAGAHTAVDLLDGLEVTAQSDRLRLVMPPHSVRMLELGAP
jgi:hypothetical protein